MATLAQSRSTHVAYPRVKAKLWAVPVGRLFYSLIFIFSGINHFSSGTISYAAASGVPYPNILVPISGALAIVGGISILLGWMTRVGAIVLLAFLVPVTFMMHAFWGIADPAMAQMQMIHFMKNLSLIGGALLLAFYGAGPISIDNRQAKQLGRR